MVTCHVPLYFAAKSAMWSKARFKVKIQEITKENNFIRKRTAILAQNINRNSRNKESVYVSKIILFQKNVKKDVKKNFLSHNYY